MRVCDVLKTPLTGVVEQKRRERVRMPFHIHQRAAKQGMKPAEAGRPKCDAIMA